MAEINKANYYAISCKRMQKLNYKNKKPFGGIEYAQLMQKEFT